MEPLDDDFPWTCRSSFTIRQVSLSSLPCGDFGLSVRFNKPFNGDRSEACLSFTEETLRSVPEWSIRGLAVGLRHHVDSPQRTTPGHSTTFEVSLWDSGVRVRELVQFGADRCNALAASYTTPGNEAVFALKRRFALRRSSCMVQYNALTGKIDLSACKVLDDGWKLVGRYCPSGEVVGVSCCGDHGAVWRTRVDLELSLSSPILPAIKSARLCFEKCLAL